MSQEQKQPSPAPASLPEHPPPSLPFHPFRMIGIIKRRGLIQELAAVYHAECLAYRPELLELEKKWDEPFIDVKSPDDIRKEKMRLPKRLNKSR